MNSGNTIFLHWKKSQKEFNKQHILLQQQINTAAIHDIRVAIKRLRALLNLYLLLKKEPEWETLFNKTETLFKILGRQRDVENCLILTNNFAKETNGSCKEWKHFLQAVLHLTKAWTNQEIHHYNKKEMAKIALLLKQDNDLPVEKEFFASLQTVINTRLSATKKHLRQPHLVRKDLKEIFYWIALFPVEIALETWHQKELHSLLDDLGNWQDYEILEVRLKHFKKDYLPKPFEEYSLLSEFQHKIRDNKQLLLKAANTKIIKWMKKVMHPE